MLSQKARNPQAPRLAVTAACAAIAVILAAGCGSSKSSSSSASTSGGSGTSSSAASAKLQGKKIGFIDVFGQAAIEQRFINATKYGIQKLGWKMSFADAVSDPSKAATAAQNFLQTGVDGIITDSIPSEFLRPVAAQAKSKDIPIVNLISKASPGVYSGDVDEPQEPLALALADQVKKDHPNGASVAAFYSSDNSTGIPRLNGLKKGFAGSNVKIVATKDIPLAKTLSDTQKATADIMNANPNIDVIVQIAAQAVPQNIAGLRSIGNKKVQIYSWYADSGNAQLLKSTPQFRAVVDSDIAKSAFIALDQLATKFSGGTISPAQQDVDVKPVIITKADLTPGLFKNEGPVPYAEMIKPYLAKWQKQYGVSGS